MIVTMFRAAGALWLACAVIALWPSWLALIPAACLVLVVIGWKEGERH